MKGYNQLTLQQRYAIYLELQEKKSYTSIAKKIGVSVSTVSREVRRNSNRHGRYQWLQAHELAMVKRERSTANRKIPDWLLKEAIELLVREDWSPEQISAFLRQQGKQISHETIYRHIRADESGELKKHCRHKMKYRRHKKRPKVTKATNIPNRVSIHERPKEADGTRVGDFELDLIVGKGQKSCLVTIVDRATSYLLVKRLETKHHDAVKKAVTQMLMPFKRSGTIKTITTDNGIEFIDHQEFGKKLGVQVYFADSYCSWQKGAIENANKLVRQYYPKGTDFRLVSDDDVRKTQIKLNRRPRKKLNFSTPTKEFYKNIN